MDVLVNLFRTLMFFFDNIIYSIIPTLYGLITYLAQIDIFSTDSGIAKLMSQIYMLLGIFMLFKLSFSFLKYIIDPESLTDSSKGIGKLVTNTIVVVVLLVTVPYIFNIAFKLQYAIVSSNILGQLLLGSSTGTQAINEEISIADFFNPNSTAFDLDSEASDRLENEAKDLQFLMYGAFFSVNYNVIPECGSNKQGEEGEGLSDSEMPTPIFGSVEMAQNEACLNKLEEYFDSEKDISTNSVTLGSFFKGISEETGEVVDGRRFGDFDKLLWWKIENEYAINYLPLISTAAGIYIVFLLLTFCIDVAVRAIKLCFLQMIAPISLVSHLDPNDSAKDGKLSKWIKECVTTYISLFIRLAVIFLVIRFISIIASGVFGDEGFASNLNANEYTIWVYLFLILGAFVFAKQVPKMLENLLGFQSSGELSLNPVKSLKENVLANPLAGGAIGGAVGTALTGASAFTNSRAQGRGIARSIASAGLGGVAGFARGAKGGFLSQGKNMLGGAFSSAGTTARRIELRTNTDLGNRLEGSFRNLTGQQSKYEMYQSQIEIYENISKSKDEIEKVAKSEVGKTNGYRQLEAHKLSLEQQFKNGVISERDYTQFVKKANDRQRQMVENYIDNSNNTTIEMHKQQINRTVKENKNLKGMSLMKTDTWKDIKNSSKIANEQSLSIKTSNEYQDAKSVDQAIKSGAMQSWRNKQN